MGTSLRVAGLDPSMCNFGMVKGVLCLHSGILDLQHLHIESTESAKKTKKTVRTNSLDLVRASLLFNALSEFIKDVDMVFVEMPVGTQSAAGMKAYGMCIMAIATINKPLVQVMPDEVKQAATGNKNATKAAMIEWATTTYPTAPWFTRKHKGTVELISKNEHVADALATIYAGVKTDTFKQARSILTLK